MKRLLLVLAACHHAPQEPEQIGPPPSEMPPAPAACPGVMYACIDPAVGCFEGAEDFREAARPQCKQVGGTEAGRCDEAGTLGSCTLYGKLVPNFVGCNTQWVRRGLLQTAEDGRAWCAKFHGTWTTTP